MKKIGKLSEANVKNVKWIQALNVWKMGWKEEWIFKYMKEVLIIYVTRSKRSKILLTSGIKNLWYESIVLEWKLFFFAFCYTDKKKVFFIGAKNFGLVLGKCNSNYVQLYQL